MSARDSSLVDLQRARALSPLDLPVPRPHPNTHTNHKKSHKSQQTKLDSHFTRIQTNSTPQPSPPQLNPTKHPNQQPDNDDLLRPIQFQHRISDSYSNDQSWLGIKIARKPKHVARLWSHNVNGIKRNNNFLQFAENLEALTQFEIDFLAITETNLN